MQTRSLHPWNLAPAEAIEVQKRLASQVSRKRDFGGVAFIAGADIAVDRDSGEGIAAVIVYSFPDLREVERASVRAPLAYPYIPGLLSFREGPLLLAAFEELKQTPDVALFDAQGIAHPRGLGLASHMGLCLDLPTIGVAKSRLFGEHEEPGNQVGDWKPLLTKEDEVIGAVLRTRRHVTPVFVSIGHRIDLPTSIEIVLACLDDTRIPKPTREADRLVGQLKLA